MGAHLRVQAPLRAGHSEQSEAQLHEGDRVWEGSVERKLRPARRVVWQGRSHHGCPLRRFPVIKRAGQGRQGPDMVRREPAVAMAPSPDGPSGFSVWHADLSAGRAAMLATWLESA